MAKAALHKTLLILLFSIFLFQFSFSQTQLWAMTNSGGQFGKGTVFNLDNNGTNFNKVIDLSPADGCAPLFTNFLQATDGKLYGLTYQGGNYNLGTLFSYDIANSTYTKLVDFDSTNGSKPLGSLMQASDGNIYGMCYKGGAYDKGILFRYDFTNSIETKLLDFDGPSKGCYPHGALLEVSEGILYGLCVQGGTNDLGTLFQYDFNLNSFNKLVDFDGTALGANPLGTLIKATDGKLWGLTVNGGVNDMGTIFSYDLTLTSLQKKFDLTDSTGKNPLGRLTQANDGKLYGLCNVGGSHHAGTLFNYNYTDSTFTRILSFDSAYHGSYPYGSLLLASNGALYGMTQLGGANGDGVVFEYNYNSSAFTKKFDFDSISGTLPYGSFVEADLSLASLNLAKSGDLMKIFPNPCSENFTIKNTTPGEYSIINTLGECIYKTYFDKSGNLQFTGLSAGIYLVTGPSLHQKIIVTE